MTSLSNKIGEYLFGSCTINRYKYQKNIEIEFSDHNFLLQRRLNDLDREAFIYSATRLFSNLVLIGGLAEMAITNEYKYPFIAIGIGEGFRKIASWHYEENIKEMNENNQKRIDQNQEIEFRKA